MNSIARRPGGASWPFFVNTPVTRIVAGDLPPVKIAPPPQAVRPFEVRHFAWNTLGSCLANG